MTPAYIQLDKKVRKGSYAASHRPKIAISVVNECLAVQPRRVSQLVFAIKAACTYTCGRLKVHTCYHEVHSACIAHLGAKGS